MLGHALQYLLAMPSDGTYKTFISLKEVEIKADKADYAPHEPMRKKAIEAERASGFSRLRDQRRPRFGQR